MFFPDANEQKMPIAAIILVVVASLVPVLLILAGVNFGSPVPVAPVPGELEGAYGIFSGSFIHTILEWSAVSVAFITVLLAFLHYHEKGEPTTPIIGLAWFCAGLIDAFHTVGADRLFPVAASHESFTEFTWLVSRVANGTILIFGAAIFLIAGPIRSREERKRGMGLVVATTCIFALAAVAVIYICASRPDLSYSLRPDASIPRWQELIPLTLYVVAAGVFLPTFYKWHPSVFTHALWISMIPHAMAQLHMAFGSTAPFDAHYHAAHLLKVLAYSVPVIGLLSDYRLAHAQEVQAEEARAGEFFVRQQAEEALMTDRGVLRIIMENTHDLVSIKDASLRYTRVNKSMAAFLGLASPRDAVGRNESEFFDEASVARFRQQDKDVLGGAQPVRDQAQDVTRGSEKIRLNISKFPLKNSEGVVVGLVTIARC